LDHVGIDPGARECLDVGASTGGFTDCLLSRGAARVMAVDAGRGQLHDRLRADPRVVVMERTNARYLTPERLAGCPSLVTIDVSFISATKVSPAIRRVASAGADVVLLVKPQFEAGPGQVSRGGVVRDPEVRAATLARALATLASQGFEVLGVVESPLRGANGNVEYLAHLRT
jgi:23S rRNA (cytidine1920-2'-O)/16S rRNA (cytidine1409-2'-O)-methyltransferase